MKRKFYAFFEGLDSQGIEETIEEYTRVPRVGWSVHTLGHNSDGFWILMERDHG